MVSSENFLGPSSVFTTARHLSHSLNFLNLSKPPQFFRVVKSSDILLLVRNTVDDRVRISRVRELVTISQLVSLLPQVALESRPDAFHSRDVLGSKIRTIQSVA